MLALEGHHPGGDAEVPHHLRNGLLSERSAEVIGTYRSTQNSDTFVCDGHIGGKATINEMRTPDAQARRVGDPLVVSEFSLDDTRVKVSPTMVGFDGPLGRAGDVDVVAVGQNQQFRVFLLKHPKVRVNGKAEEEGTKAAPLARAN
jgi:hypothetical protein